MILLSAHCVSVCPVLGIFGFLPLRQHQSNSVLHRPFYPFAGAVLQSVASLSKKMHSRILSLGVLLFAQFVHAQSEVAAEPHDFNVTEALLQNGVAPELLAPTNITARQDSAHPTCPLMVRSVDWEGRSHIDI